MTKREQEHAHQMMKIEGLRKNGVQKEIFEEGYKKGIDTGYHIAQRKSGIAIIFVTLITWIITYLIMK